MEIEPDLNMHEFLKQSRADLGLSQLAVAQRGGLEPSIISRNERGLSPQMTWKVAVRHLHGLGYRIHAEYDPSLPPWQRPLWEADDEPT